MDYFHEHRHENVPEQELAAWEQAAVSVADIRHHRFCLGEDIRNYCVPSSLFLYVWGGEGQVWLNDMPYQLERFGLFHCGKGTRFSVLPSRHEQLECCMVLYKAVMPLIGRRGLARLPEQSNPFQRQYGISPANPLLLLERLKHMHKRWHGASPLRRLYVKAAFSQFVYDVYEELDSAAGRLQPDISAMVQSYMSQHYHEDISIQGLSESLHISRSQLTRAFKQQIGESPQEFLIKRRIRAAQERLLGSNATLWEIAAACGFTDEYHLIRTFKSRLGVTPGEFRAKSAPRMRHDAIGWDTQAPYTKGRIVRQFKLQDKGDYTMGTKTRANMMITAMLGLMMLLSACGGDGAASNASGGAPASSPSAPVQSAGPQESATRMVQTAMGEVEVPANPQRVIVNYMTGDVLAFGIPLAANSEMPENVPFYDQLKDIPVLENWEKETLLSHDPDLIIGGHENQLQFESIAPVVIVPFGSTLEDRIRSLGQIFGMEDKAEQLLAQYFDGVDAAKRQLAEAGVLDRTITVFQEIDDGGKLRAFVGNAGRGTNFLYGQLGMKASPKIEEDLIQNSELGNADYSLEVLPQYAGDYILYIYQGENPNPSIVENAVWTSVPAVKEGKVIYAPYDSFYFSDILSLQEQQRILTDALLDRAK